MLALALALTAAVPQASLDSVARDGVFRHVADGKKGVWVQSLKGDWYYAQFGGPCSRLIDGYGLRFDVSGNGRLDKNSAVVADGQRCPFVSFVRSTAPPKVRRR